ncbi:hypothetical protein ACE0DR_26715 [Azotobacter sp. CWF10]
MSAYVIDSALFRDQFGTEAMRRIFSDETTVQRWLDVEAALAKVQGELGIIPSQAANEIRRKARVELIDLGALKAEMDRTAHPIVPLLRVIKQVCDGDAGEYVHWGRPPRTSSTAAPCCNCATASTRSSATCAGCWTTCCNWPRPIATG